MANDVPIEVERLLRWAESGEGVLNQHPSICKVPSILRDLSPDSFKPQLVSIGPLHKEDTNVQEIRRLKRTYLHDLLQRETSPPKQPKTKLEECLQRVNASIANIKSAYSPTKYSDNELAIMMVIDGCFILEFCWKDFFDKEKLFRQPFPISIDLMLLENQIPFFVLQHIFDLTKPAINRPVTLLLHKLFLKSPRYFDLTKPDSINLSLTSLLHEVLLKYVHPFYTSPNTELPDDFSIPEFLNNSNHVHVLDCLHKIYQFRSSAIVDTALNYNHTAVELERSGVNFKPQKDKNKAMAMKYSRFSCFWWPWRKPFTFVMPTLVIKDYTEAVLRNFIAYEQMSPQVNHYFTSYSCVMDMLIDNEADVGTLVESRVLINHLGPHKDAATMINNLCKNIQVEKFYYFNELQALDRYYTFYWLARLRRTYFSTPWSFCSLLAGIIALIFTVLSGIYSVMTYYN